MEARCLSSNSFPKTIEILPTATAASVNTKQICIKYQSKRFRSVTTRCHSGPVPASPSPSPSPYRKDEASPLLTSDWRAFRAKLVAGERSLPSQSSLSLSPVDRSRDTWAHSIPELEKGCLMIATEKLDGVDVFERTVILVLSTEPVGPTGVILNKPSLLSIKEMRSSPLDVSPAISDRPLFFGGPMEDGLFLVSPDEKGRRNIEKSGAFEEVMDELYYGTADNVKCAAEMVEGDKIKVRDCRFFDGYCAWEGTQLREDIRAGYWALAACSPSIIGLSSDGHSGLWEEIRGLISPAKVW